VCACSLPLGVLANTNQVSVDLVLSKKSISFTMLFFALFMGGLCVIAF
jgi:hypothetical protein